MDRVYFYVKGCRVPNLLSTGHLCCTRNTGIALLCLWALPVANAERRSEARKPLRLQQQQQRDLQQLQLEQRQRQMQRGSFGTPAATPALPPDIAKDEHCWPLSGTPGRGHTVQPCPVE